MFARLAQQILRHRRLILLVFGICIVLGATQVNRIGFNFTPQQLFKSSSDVHDFREEFAAEFGREDNLLIAIVEADDVFDPANLEWFRDSVDRFRELDKVKSADSLATVEIPRSGESPGVLTTRPLLGESGPVSAEDAERLRELAHADPLLQDRMVNRDGTRAVLFLWLNDELQDVTKLRDTIQEVQALVEASPPPPGVSVTWGGIPHLRQEIVENLKWQQMVFVPATAVAYILILFLLFRRFSGVVIPMGTVGITLMLVTLMMVWTGSDINIINNVLPSLVFIIGVSDCIHMLTRDAEETERGAGREEAISFMVRHTGLACLLTSTTTAVGFFSLLVADTEILQNFGWQAAVAVLLAYVSTLLFLPAALSYLRPVSRQSVSSDNSKGSKAWLESRLDQLGRGILDHPWSVVFCGTLLLGLAAFSASTVKIDTLLLEVYDEDHPTYQTISLLEKEFGGVLPVEVSLQAESPDAFKSPELFASLDKVAAFAIEDPVVLSTRSVVDFHQAARAALLADPAERQVLARSREEIEQIDLLIAPGPDSRTGSNQFIDSDWSHARILLTVADDGAREQLRLGRSLKTHLDEVFEGTDVTYKLTGDAYVASLSLDSFIRDLFSSLLLAIVIIFAMMTGVFRSFKLGLISIIPNTIPLLVTFGFMGLMKIDLNTTTIITFAISLGLAVDDTIHFLARFQEELGRSDDIREVILATYNGAGRAIMLTSLLLLVGLAVLLFSSFVPTRYFGMLTGVTIFGAVIADLFILPAVLFLAYRSSDAEPTVDL